VARKDYKGQENGRAGRALVGALVLGQVAVIFIGILLSSTNVFAGDTLANSLMLLLGALVGGGTLGALLGLLSDSL
jgi:hypothetical protein